MNSLTIQTPQIKIPAALQKKVKAHNEAAQEVANGKALIESDIRQLSNQNPLSVDVDKLNEYDNGAASKKLQFIQREAELVNQASELNQSIRELLDKEIAAQQPKVQEALESVLSKLAEVGVTIESQDAWPSNPRSAQAQLESQAKKSTDYVKAKSQLDYLANEARQRAQLRHEFDGSLKELKTQASSLVLRILRGAA